MVHLLSVRASELPIHRFVRISSCAFVTFKWFYSNVSKLMKPQTCFIWEFSRTYYVTLKLCTVGENVPLRISFSRKFFPTNITFKWFLLIVSGQMLDQISSLCKYLFRHSRRISSFTRITSKCGFSSVWVCWWRFKLNSYDPKDFSPEWTQKWSCKWLSCLNV